MKKIHQFRTPGQPEGVRATLAIIALGVAVHAILRLLQLGRTAPYGEPFVEKLEWYIFHAISYDTLCTLPLFLPFLMFFWFRTKALSPVAHFTVIKFMTLLQALILSFSGLDHEMMRFLSLHGGISQFRTYIGMETVRDLPELLSIDAGGVGLPVLTIIGSGLFALGTGPAVIRNFQKNKRSIRRWILGFLILCIFSYALIFHIWKGGFRLLKLRPIVASIVLEIGEETINSPLAPEERDPLAQQFQQLWKNGSSSSWAFPDSRAPFYRVPARLNCQTRPHPACDMDQDKDGFTGREDCNDNNASVFPGAPEIPANGIDEDCSGMDDKPWNVVVIFMESHRAINVGHLKEEGALHSSTPFLDSLAAGKSGRSFTRYQVNGVPTIEAFVNAHCSAYTKSWGHAATDNTRTRLHCLPQILGERGFYTRFFTAAAPDWDNQTFWLSKWYDETDFDRDRQTDLTMFTHMGDWMVSNLSDKEPFFIGAITKNNHFPFNAISDMNEEERSNTPNNMDATMRYSDRSLKAFFESIKEAPWYDNTLFIITADHGFNWGEKGFYRLGDPLHRPSTWIPLVFVGDHPEIAQLEKMDDTLSSHVDLAPTILDLLAIETANAFVGHSILDPAFRRNPHVFASHGSEIAWETPEERLLLSQVARPREEGEERFLATDFHMETPLPLPEKITHLRSLVYAIQSLTDDVFTHDSVLPPIEENGEDNASGEN